MRALLIFPLFILLPLSLSAAPGEVSEEGGAEEAEEVVKHQPLRLLTYNIHHGQGTDDEVDLERIAQVITARKVVLVAIQEVDVKTERSGGVDQAAELARLTGMYYAFGKFMDHEGGEYGQMVLSKFPIKKVRNLTLPPGPEPRTALAVEVEVPFGEKAERLVFVGIHFYASEQERSAQARRLTKLLEPELEDGVPIVLAGDFNSTPGSKPMLILGKNWIDPTVRKDDRTWPSVRPKVEIDHILYTPADRLNFLKSKVIVEKVASDHRPVMTVLMLRAAK